MKAFLHTVMSASVGQLLILVAQGFMTRIFRIWLRNIPGIALLCHRLPSGYPIIAGRKQQR
ncbi:hypothetical protein DDR43_23100 [Salmonella enterica subsp. enterica serovar Cotham]|nr:hypothetical protein [Salmonella enterica subsp. enterica serovar Cotham]